jgi:hypothetical protein
MLRFSWLVLVVVCAIEAQEPAPTRVPVECGQDDLRALQLTCPAAHPCPVYLELNGIESAGSHIYITGNLHADDATLFSILFASDDSGATWREPHERIRGAGLDLVQFIDFETGWASGESLGAIPRDPFLLVTRDGGKTWSNRPVFAESRAGTIDFFHFNSKTQGKLWIGRPLSGEPGSRYEAYETQDGGESWVLLTAGDKPFPQSSRPAPAGDYRLRTDRATGAYRVERRAPAGWETVASFPVKAGECREPDLPPPTEQEVPPPGPDGTEP